jgi:PAB-dependent poly(A)-specific ribonuclease subunit 2
VIDPFIKVFDLRASQTLPPIPFSTGPALICPMPRRGSSLVVASSQGLVNIVDATDPTANEFYQA